jgi:hypothetical protein
VSIPGNVKKKGKEGREIEREGGREGGRREEEKHP